MEQQAAPSTPERSIAQRMEALTNANAVRVRRAAFKRDVKAGRASIIDAILAPPAWLAGAKVFELLLAVPKYGQVKVNRILLLARISPSKTIGGLSPRQRSELVAMMRGVVVRRPVLSPAIASLLPAAPPIRPASTPLAEPTTFQRGVLALAVLEFGEINRLNVAAAANALMTNPGAVVRACDDLKLTGLMDQRGRATDAGRACCSVFPTATAA